jgi:hypothetical protein
MFSGGHHRIAQVGDRAGGVINTDSTVEGSVITGRLRSRPGSALFAKLARFANNLNVLKLISPFVLKSAVANLKYVNFVQHSCQNFAFVFVALAVFFATWSDQSAT